MSKPEKAPNYDDLLRRENLRLKHLINIACGAPLDGWPPKTQDWDWEGCLDDLHFAIQRGELEGTTHFQKKRHDRAGLRSLSEYLTKPERKNNRRWGPLHKVNRQREKVCGLTLPGEPKPSLKERREEWAKRQADLRAGRDKTGLTAKTYKKASEIIGQEEGLDATYIAREARRARLGR